MSEGWSWISTVEEAARLISVDADEATQDAVLRVLARSRALFTGHFALHRSRHTSTMLRFRGIGRDAEAMRIIVDAIAAGASRDVQRALCDATILAPESSGFFLGTALANRYGTTLAVAQTDLRRLPAPTLLVGTIRPNDRVVLVNDVASTGASLDALRQLVAERGGLAVGVVLFGVVGSAAVVEYCAKWQLPSRWLVTARWETYGPEVCRGCKADEPLIPVAEIT